MELQSGAKTTAPRSISKYKYFIHRQRRC